MGEKLSGLSIKDLTDLENQLDMSLRSIRMKKAKSKPFKILWLLNIPFIKSTLILNVIILLWQEQILTDEIKELNRKVLPENYHKSLRLVF